MSVNALASPNLINYNALISLLMAIQSNMQLNNFVQNQPLIANNSIFNANINKSQQFNGNLFGFASRGTNSLPSMNHSAFKSLTSYKEQKMLDDAAAASVKFALNFKIPDFKKKKK